MATIGSLFGLLGVLLFSPLGLVSITMGIMALSQMDPEEKQKSVWRDGTKCRAVAAIVSGLIAIAVWIYSIIRILSH
ncbi:hypothetical protein SDC9_211736 [bioreactor metagenome]|uniref:DUF4190 domain-containing protein n=1 Tax=bioreactor metagenome TaxID=1076179 RepID=A0A645JKT6_9ZZZZ